MAMRRFKLRLWRSVFAATKCIEPRPIPQGIE